MPSPPSSSCQLAAPLTCTRIGVLALYRRFVQMKQKVTFARPSGVVFRACAELAIPEIAAVRFEGGVFGFSICVRKIFAEGLSCCDADRTLQCL